MPQPEKQKKQQQRKVKKTSQDIQADKFLKGFNDGRNCSEEQFKASRWVLRTIPYNLGYSIGKGFSNCPSS